MSAGRPIGSRGINTNQKLMEGTFDSVIYELNKYAKQLDTLRSKALRDYNEIKVLARDQGDMIQMEHIRANSLKSLENFFKLKAEAIKLLLLVVDKMSKGKAEEVSKKFDKDDSQLESYVEQLKEDLRKNRRL